MPRYCSEEMNVLKLAIGAQTIVRWLSVTVLQISLEIHLAYTNVSLNAEMLEGEWTKLVFIFPTGKKFKNAGKKFKK